MDALVHLIYASSSAHPIGEPELVELLERARSSNADLNVTGMLLHSDGAFFQVLEGDADAVDPLYEKISRDQRHANVVLIVREAIYQRAFADWSMGFESVTRETVAGLVGVNDFFQGRSCFDDLTPGRAKKLLDAFSAGRWRNPGVAAA